MATLEELSQGVPEVHRSIPSQAGREPGPIADILIVLDDDPTGTQSVRDLPVLTTWSETDFEWAFGCGSAAIYVVTNSRSLSAVDAQRVTTEVVERALKTASRLGIRPTFVSRSDSTLRGHFPLETDTIADVIETAGRHVDAVILVPAFPEAGRVTIHGIHYAKIAGDYIPVAESEFAKDATFGYSNSTLTKWVEERSQGSYPAQDVVTIGITDLRSNISKVISRLGTMSGRQVVVADCITEDDLSLLALALRTAERQGKDFVYRVGPPFVRAMIRQKLSPPLTGAEIDRVVADFDTPRNRAPGGLIVVGSHTQTTTEQLKTLIGSVKSTVFELSVSAALDKNTRDLYLLDLARKIEESLQSSMLVILHTSRDLVKGTDGDASLDIARTVSSALSKVVSKVLETTSPKFVIAKGGITSSDLAVHGLHIRHAYVVGNVLPGLVALWIAVDGPSTGVPYVVFPGNVGDTDSLLEAYRVVESCVS